MTCQHDAMILLHYNYVPNPETGKFDGANHGMNEIHWCRKCGAYRRVSYNARGEPISTGIGNSEWVMPILAMETP